MAYIRILVAEEQRLVREKLYRLIDEQVDMRIVGVARTSSEVLVQIKRLQPNILLLDIAMSRQRRTQLVKTISAVAPATRVVVLALYGEETYRFQVFKGGGSRFSVQAGSGVELLHAIRTASAGERSLFSSLFGVGKYFS